MSRKNDEKTLIDQIVEKKLQEYRIHMNSDKQLRMLVNMKKNIVRETEKIIEEFYRKSNSSIKPKTLFGAATYVAAIRNKTPFTQNKAAELFDTNVVSIRNMTKRLVSEEEHQKIQTFNKENKRNKFLQKMERRRQEKSEV